MKNGKGGHDAPHGRVTEWQTSMRDDISTLRLFAWAQYGRGSRPKDVEIDALERRVHLRFPKAELVRLRRTFVPRAGGGEPVRVTWELQWIVREDC